jgi:hypothetical protein
MILEGGRAPGRGNAGGQQPLDMINERALFQTAGEFVSAGALPAGAFHQVADVKVESISLNWHWHARKRDHFVFEKTAPARPPTRDPAGR